MKQEYRKPLLFVERFTLCQSIAESGCGAPAGGNTLGKPAHAEKSTCGWDMGNIVVWTNEMSSCTVKYGSDAPYDGICYNNPNGGTTIFGSF